MSAPFTPVSPEEMRALQLALLDAFDRHCRDSRLSYYLWAGTLLGARRHGGYIPWDDDIDVTMPRADYERLRRGFAGSALAGHFRLHHLATDPAHEQPVMKLADPRALVLGNTPAPVGVNLDIFPLDRWPAGRLGSAAAGFGLRMLFHLRWLSHARVLQPEWNPGKRALVAALNATQGWFSTRVTNGWIDGYLRRLGGRCVTVGAYHIGPPAKLGREAYGEPSWVTFEGRTLPAPADPDAVLTYLYGDWRVPPPPEHQHGHPRSAVVWVDAQTLDALHALDHRTQATVRNLADLQAIARKASAREPVSEPRSAPVAALISKSGPEAP
jgi:lipopolysaccharide cholinephosphotransferase